MQHSQQTPFKVRRKPVSGRAVYSSFGRQTADSVCRVVCSMVAIAAACVIPEGSPTAFCGVAKRPNILIAISDDVSFPHASAYGSKMVRTPAFDRVAADGVLMTQAFCPAPGCSPSRAAFLTGRHIWMLEEAGTHASFFQTKYRTFPEVLADAGYFTGSTGKGWGPGDFKKNGRKENPAGRSFSSRKGYVEGFREFLKARPDNAPFCFWFGSHDAHRSYKKESGVQSGKKLRDAEVPEFLPDRPEIRSDLLDYAFEVERFDHDCDQMLKILEQRGELENTLIIITSDNGMPFPRAKANCYEYGLHMPLAICWKQKIPAGRTLNDLVSFVDLTATIYDAAQVAPPEEFPVIGKSLLPELTSTSQGVVNAARAAVFAGRERHSSSRYLTLSYPQRAIRTHQFLYIYNFRPERWPAGAPQKYNKVTFDHDGRLLSFELGPMHAAYHDIDACPSLSYLINRRDDTEINRFLQLAVAHRPASELFDIRKDPACLNNLCGQPEFAETQKHLHHQLMTELRNTGDTRVLDGGDIWETYPRVSSIRWFPEPEWAQKNPQSVPEVPWLRSRQPRARKSPTPQ